MLHSPSAFAAHVPGCQLARVAGRRIFTVVTVSRAQGIRRFRSFLLSLTVLYDIVQHMGYAYYNAAATISDARQRLAPLNVLTSC